MSAAFTFQRNGRNGKTALVIAAVWLILAGAWAFLDAALWLFGFLGLFTLPALWDLICDPSSGLNLTDATLAWHSGKRHGEVPLAEIDHIRLDTRLDFSVRATLVLHTGAKVRLPFEATPPHQAFEDALIARGLKTRRTHFQLMQ